MENLGGHGEQVCRNTSPSLKATIPKTSFPWYSPLFGILPERWILTVSEFPRGYAPLFQMLLRSATRVTRSISGTSCTSGVPWHPLVATSSFHSCCSASSFWSSLPSSSICVRLGNHPAGGSNYWQRTFAREQFLVKYRSKTSWSRNSLISPCHVSPLPLYIQTPPNPSPQLALSSTFSSKPSKEDSPKPGIIARWHWSWHLFGDDTSW